MFKWAVGFAVVAVFAATLGITVIVVGVSGAAKALFVLVLLLFVSTVLLALFSTGAPKR